MMDNSSSAILPEGVKARHVYMSLREDIASGVHAVDSCLPGEQKLAVSFGVSRVTIRRALDALCAEGLIERLAGIGSRVLSPTAANKPVGMDFSTLMPQLAEMTRATTARLLSFTYTKPPEHIRKAMALDEQARVQMATRVRLADNQPFSYLTTYVPETIASNYSESDLATSPMYALLERSGVNIDSAHQSVSACLASPVVANALGIAVGSAMLSLDRIVRDENGCGVEYLSAQYRPELFRLDMELARVSEGASRHWQPVIETRKQSQSSNANSRRNTSDKRKSTATGNRKRASA